MSCTVFALPYAIAWVVGAFVAGTAQVISESNQLNDESLMFGSLEQENLNNINQSCDDVQVISEKHFIEKSLETPFMDKDILLKTLEEHGGRRISEDEFGKISGTVDNYTLTFEKMEADKPYFVRISCLETDNAEEKIGDLSSEYALNVQEETYLNIIEKLKENNMQIEDEEVMDDNTIVLTVNLD